MFGKSDDPSFRAPANRSGKMNQSGFKRTAGQNEKGGVSALHFEKRLFAAPTPSTLPLKVSSAVAV
jgi:hypothetical protein